MAMEATATLIKVVTGTVTVMAMATPTTTITTGTGTVGTGTVAGGVMESANAGSGHHTDTNGFATERLKETGRSLVAGTHQSAFCLRNAGSLAIFAAIRLASSRVEVDPRRSQPVYPEGEPPNPSTP